MEAKKKEYGHRKMVAWKNLDRIEEMVQRVILKSIPKHCFNLIDQIDRASSSAGANFVEGYYSGSIREYIKFLKYSKRSLAELQDWVRRVYFKKYISKETYEEFDDLCIKTLFLSNRLINALQRTLPSKSSKP